MNTTSPNSSASRPVPLTEEDALLRELVQESSAHPAVHHPWLQAISRLEFADPVTELRRYAVEYHGYASWFPRYLRTVIDRLDDPESRELLERNLQEEGGDLDPEDCEALRGVGLDPDALVGIPHPVLFRRFCTALGIGDHELSQPTPAAALWRRSFLGYLGRATPAQAVGALGLGTESIVRPVYEQILAGIRKVRGLRREDYVFFELHCLVDDQHQEDLLDVARQLMRQPGGVHGLRDGMRTALALRQRFWDDLLGSSDAGHEVRIA